MSNGSRIYTQGYEKWQRTRGYATPPKWLIGKSSFKNVTSGSGCIGCMSKGFFIIFFVLYYFWVFAVALVHYQLHNLEKLPTVGPLFEFIGQMGKDISESDIHRVCIIVPALIFLSLAMLFYGSQLISKDKRANALQVYFSKAISRSDYVVGKFVTVAGFTASVTLVPSLLILCIGLIFAPDHIAFFKESWFIPLSTIAYWLLLTLVYGSITLLSSSLFDKSYMAAVAFIGFMFLTFAASFMLQFIFGISDFLRAMIVTFNLYDLGNSLYTFKAGSPSLLFWEAANMLVMSVAFVTLIFRKIQPVEVIQ